MRATHEKFLELGLESPYNQEWMDRAGMDHRITTKIDVSSHHAVRRQALLAHATQIDPTSRFWFGLPPEVVAYPFDDYILARSLVGETGDPGDVAETDLFAGLRDRARR
jgi:mycothiol S-conjugate amidase